MATSSFGVVYCLGIVCIIFCVSLACFFVPIFVSNVATSGLYFNMVWCGFAVGGDARDLML